MRTTIDGAGRVVVPKRFRDELRLQAGQTLEINARDGRIEIEVPAVPMRLERRRGRLVAVPEEALPALTAAQVREALERVRR